MIAVSIIKPWFVLVCVFSFDLSTGGFLFAKPESTRPADVVPLNDVQSATSIFLLHSEYIIGT